MTLFEGKIAIVTGAASGIGLELVRQLTDAGATVVAADVDQPRLEKSIHSLAPSSGQVETQVIDVSIMESVQALIDDTVEKHGRIDFMFNNAGVGGTSGEVRDQTPDDWNRIVQINLMSVIHGSSFAYKHMRAQGSGHIINTASAAGLLGAPHMIPYGTTKAAIVSFSRDLRMEAKAFGVAVTVLCPGYVESRIFENTVTGSVDVPKTRELVPFKILPVDRAVAKMLQGVRSNKSMVVLPGYVKLLWFLRRHFPMTFDRITGKGLIDDLRKARLPED